MYSHSPRRRYEKLKIQKSSKYSHFSRFSRRHYEAAYQTLNQRIQATEVQNGTRDDGLPWEHGLLRDRDATLNRIRQLQVELQELQQLQATDGWTLEQTLSIDSQIIKINVAVGQAASIDAWLK
jgi:hypothetical protein